MAKTGSFQINKFDPILLSSQICAFQSFLYVTLCIILLLGLSFLNINLSLSALFDFRVSKRLFALLKYLTMLVFIPPAYQRVERGRCSHNFIFHHQFLIRCNLSVDLCEAPENVSGLLVMNLIQCLVGLTH